MRLDELDFEFPEELIAQRPAEPRDSCRLMHLRSDGARRHKRFSELPSLLRPGDTLVFNDSKVLPARLFAVKPTGGRVELLFLHPATDDQRESGDLSSKAELWEALAKPSHRLRPGGELLLDGGEALTLRVSLGEGSWLIEGPDGISLVSLMERYGVLPLPPYIRDYAGDPDLYQTVYAAHLGSAAAPTAGLHFTGDMLKVLKAQGVGIANVTLHVGLDTFHPIREEIVEDHPIHRETYVVTGDNLHLLRSTKERGGRLVAVGTTATRVLETMAAQGLFEPGPSDTGDRRAAVREEGVGGETQIFITPGYRFGAVDALLTNFHLPRSSVLALVMAFAGVDQLRAAYQEAIDHRYRFFSFGDAMLLDKQEAGTDRKGGR